jgi:hypothetical protein
MNHLPLAFLAQPRNPVGMSKVIVLGDIDPFRHILVSSLRACGIEATESSLGGKFVQQQLEAEHPDVVIIHPPEGVFAGAYLERVSAVTRGARLFVISESNTVAAAGDGSVSYVSRVQVRELVDTVRRLAGTQP